MLWIGLIIGLFIGANVGLILYGMVASKKINGGCKRYHSEISEASMCCM